ncbi:MAG: RNA-binding protein [Anaerolineae bacterium]|nr:RNA-binding protein [Anaerolineae bacterium]
MQNRLYVGNLPYSTTDEQLREYFGEYGDVQEIAIITDRETGLSKGFGFVTMTTEEDAVAAMNGLNGTAFGGRTIKVDLARPRAERRPRQQDYNRR